MFINVYNIIALLNNFKYRVRKFGFSAPEFSDFHFFFNFLNTIPKSLRFADFISSIKY